MAGDHTGKGTPEDRSKTSQRAADIAKHLIKNAPKDPPKGKGGNKK